jgi:Flp pilus assembly protein TadG
MKNIKHYINRFRDDDQGSLTIEAVLILPFLFWAYVGCYTYFDAFRQKTEIVRSSYSIADMLSRETNAIDQDYIDGLNTAYDLLTNTGAATELRVTVVIYDEDDGEFDLGWSNVAGTKPALTKGDLNSAEWLGRIPAMADADSAVIVETWSTFTPVFAGVGISTSELEQINIVRPRFAAQLPWES